MMPMSGAGMAVDVADRAVALGAQFDPRDIATDARSRRRIGVFTHDLARTARASDSRDCAVTVAFEHLARRASAARRSRRRRLRRSGPGWPRRHRWASGEAGSLSGSSQIRIAYLRAEDIGVAHPLDARERCPAGWWRASPTRRRWCAGRSCRRRPTIIRKSGIDLVTCDALLLHLLRQPRYAPLHLVLDLDLGDVGIGALVEGRR